MDASNDPKLKELMSFLTENEHMSGAKLINYLICYAGHKFHCTKLSHIVNPVEYEQMQVLAEKAGFTDLNSYVNKKEKGSIYKLDPANPQLMGQKGTDPYDLANQITCRSYENPLTDYKTLHDISLRIRKLKKTIANDVNAEKASEELKALYQYRSECLMPGNKIKNYNPEISRVYQSLFNAISRLLHKLPKEKVYLMGYVKKHLVTGMDFS